MKYPILSEEKAHPGREAELIAIREFREKLVNRLAVLSWTGEERAALLRILWEIYHSDGRFTVEEKADFEAHAALLFCSRVEMEALELDDAFAILRGLPGRLDVVYFWIVGALFADGVLDPLEEQFLQTVVQKYKLDEEELRERILLPKGGLDAQFLEWMGTFEERTRLWLAHAARSSA